MSFRVKALVFDTNVFGKSVEPRLTTIEQWADACERHDAELWIPHLVAAELAQRVIDATNEAQRQAEAHNKRRAKWGFPPSELPEEIDADDVVAVIEAAGARIIPTYPDAAAEAILDQVLQRGPGTKKSEVKTGAADSAWLRSVLAHNGGSFEDLIVVSGDAGAINKLCDALEVDPPDLVPHLNGIQDLLGEATRATEEQAAAYTRAVRTILDSNGIESVLDLNHRNFWWEPVLPEGFHESWEHQATAGVELQSVDVRDAYFDAWSQSVSAELRLEVQVEELYARQDTWGNQVENCSVMYTGCVECDATVFDIDARQPVVSEFEDVYLAVDDDPDIQPY